MKFRILTAFIFSLLSFCSLATEAKFYNINEIFGTSAKETYSICKDDKGFIWTSSKTGILRISDNDLRSYQLPHKKNDAVFTKIIYQNSQLIAYTTSNGQLFSYNELYDRFELFIDLQLALNNQYVNIWEVIIDNESTVWIATSFGLYQYKNKELTATSDKPTEIQCMIPYKDQYIFTATQNGIFILNTKTMKKTSIYKYKFNNEFLVSAFLYDKEKRQLWIGTISSGLFKYDIEQKLFSAIAANELPKYPILSIEKNNTLFIGFDGQGIWEISDDNNTILNIYKEDADNPFSLRGNGVYDIFCDNNKRIWVATYTGGLSFFDQKSLLVTQLMHQINNENSLVHNYVNKILEDSKGNIWFATNNGVSRWDTSTNKWNTYLPKKLGQTNVIQALCEDRDGNIWVGTYSSGVYMLDKNTGKIIKHLSHEENTAGFSSQFIIDIYSDSQENIWLGGTRNINCYLQNEKKFRYYGSQPIRSFAELSSDKMLLACTYGLVLLDKGSGESTVLISNYLMQDLWVHEDDIWATTSGEGLIHYNYKTGAIKKYTTDSGFSSNYINSIIYANNYLWLGTENGLCRFNPIDESVIAYTTVLPFSETSFNLNSCLQLKNGNLIWGTDRGAIMFNPDSLYETEINGRLFFQDIVVSGSSIRKSEALMEEIPIDKKSQLTLNYDQNNFVLELLSVGTSMSRVKFSWKMEGLDTDWNQPSFLNLASYPNLPSGNLELKIRMFDTSLSKIIDERSLIIHIIPPFWKTWWFYSIITAVIFILIVYFFIAYSNHLKQKHAKDKIRFFTNIAHDIRTSLTLVKAPIEELGKAPELSKESLYYLNLAAEQSDKLLVVSNQLLDFQKVDTGKEMLYLAMADIVHIVHKRILMFDTMAQKKNIRLLFSSNNQSYITAIDELKIEKVIDNLLSNAIKYSHADNKVEITLTCSDKEWSLVVTDYGLGIANGAKNKLFNEFYRESNAANSKIIGSGIGLLLIKEYIMIHAGKVSLESKPNEGSSFKIIVPYKKVNKTSNILESENTQSARNIVDYVQRVNTDKIDTEKTTTLLIVEDNEELRNFLQRSLEKHYLTLTANDGIEAWKLIEKKAPDLVLSDVMMPNMDGFELCKQIKSNFETSHIPVILLTALSEKVNQLEGLGLGADDYIVKPFDVSLLLQRIKVIHRNREIIKEKALKLVSQPNKEQAIYSNELNDKFVKKALEVVHSNIANNNFGKDEFAYDMNVSPSLLYQKMKSLTRLSPTDFIRTIRLTHAMELLNSRKYSVTEISEMCGFSSANYFSTVFKKHFGKSPTDILN